MFPGCHHPGALLPRYHERREGGHEVVLQRQVQGSPLLCIRVAGVLVDRPEDLFDCFEGIQSLHEFLCLTPWNKRYNRLGVDKVKPKGWFKFLLTDK